MICPFCKTSLFLKKALKGVQYNCKNTTCIDFIINIFPTHVDLWFEIPNAPMEVFILVGCGYLKDVFTVFLKQKDTYDVIHSSGQLVELDFDNIVNQINTLITFQ